MIDAEVFVDSDPEAGSLKPWRCEAALEKLKILRSMSGVNGQCLELSLESGLDKLKELCVTGLLTQIGVKEVQWMVKSWLSLSVIHGLDEGAGDEAKGRLPENVL